ncbi:hypothetical protein QZH41_017620 [Actinostola sp. cb2023]|nr:hypothetical protein QZH41_017620 [Actinostola sp. cb2023]
MILYSGDDETPRAGGPDKFLSNVQVKDTGLCVWSGPATFKVSCEMKLKTYPFDRQTCVLRFGSFSYANNQLRLKVFKTKKSRAVFVDLSHGRSNDSYEHELRSMLLSNYDRVVRPQQRKGNNVPVIVKFGLKLNRLIKVDIKSEVFIVDTWVIMNWNNSFFSWDKTKYGGTDRIRFEPTEIWFPDISLYNNADPDTPRAGGPSVFVSNVEVQSTGLNIWSGPYTFVASCDMTLNSWPFDDQECSLRFGSFTYPAHLLKITTFQTKSSKGVKYPVSAVMRAFLYLFLKLEFLFPDNFQESGNWDLNSDLKIELKDADFGNCCPYKFSEIAYTIKIQRKFQYHMFYMVSPCLVLAMLTLLSFWIPSESGERVGFVTTLLLGMMVFLLIVPDSLPESSQSIPLLGILMMATMVMIGMALLGTVFVLRCYHATGTPPRYLRCLVRPTKLKQTAPSDAIENPKTSTNDINLKVVPQPVPQPRVSFAVPEIEFTWQMVASKIDNIFFWCMFVVGLVVYIVILTYQF